MSETLEAPEVPVRDDIRASIESAMAVVDAPRVDTPEPAAGETQEQADQRARDERGRFAKQEKTEEVVAPEVTPPAETTPETPATPEAPKLEAPPLWTAADKELFGKSPPEVQQFMLRRMGEFERDYTHKTQQLSALRRDFEPVRQLFEPHREAMNAKGFTPATLIAGYVQTEGALMNPQTAAKAAAQIIKGYQVDPDAVMRELGWQPPAPQQPQPQQFGEDGLPIPQQQQMQLPPEVLAHINGLTERFSTWEQQQQQRAHQEQQERAWQHQQATTRVMSEIERFKVETGPDGRPLRPYFAELENEMAAHAAVIVKNGGDTPPLAELYETAVWANPVTRARLQADQAAVQETQRQAAEAKRQTEARAKAARAQNAGSSVTGAPGTGHAEARATGDLSLREQIRAAREEQLN